MSCVQRPPIRRNGGGKNALFTIKGYAGDRVTVVWDPVYAGYNVIESSGTDGGVASKEQEVSCMQCALAHNSRN